MCLEPEQLFGTAPNLPQIGEYPADRKCRAHCPPLADEHRPLLPQVPHLQGPHPDAARQLQPGSGPEPRDQLQLVRPELRRRGGVGRAAARSDQACAAHDPHPPGVELTNKADASIWPDSLLVYFVNVSVVFRLFCKLVLFCLGFV